MKDLGLDSILSSIKIDGESPYVQAEEEAWNNVPLWISSGAPSLNFAVGGYKRGRCGGIPIGKAIEISGLESCGKSVLLDHIIRESLKAGAAFFLCDSEHAHIPERMAAVGVDPTNFRFIEKPKGLIDLEEDEGKTKKKKKSSSKAGQDLDVTLEEFFSIARQTVLNFRKRVGLEIPIIIALDSLAAIKTQLQSGADEFGMPERLDKAKVMEDQFNRLCSLVTKMNGSVILVNQQKTKPGVVFGNPLYTPGGDSKNFAFSLRIHLGATKPIRLADAIVDIPGEHIDSDVLGIFCKGKIDKNKLAEPFHEFRFPLLFDRGIVWEWALAMAIIDREKWRFCEDFVKDGNTYYFHDEKLGTGEKGLAQALISDPVLAMSIEEELFGDNLEA